MSHVTYQKEVNAFSFVFVRNFLYSSELLVWILTVMYAPAEPITSIGQSLVIYIATKIEIGTLQWAMDTL